MQRRSPSWRRGLGRAGTICAAGIAVSTLSVGVGASAAAAKKAAKSPSYGFTAPAQSSGALTVWVDSTRLPIAKEYAKTHPNVKLNIVTYDGDANGSNSFKTKEELFNRAGSGWPDVTFTADNNSASWGSNLGTKDLAPLSKGLVPTSELNSFAKGSLSVCTVAGVTYCFRNDLAQNVLWYNAPLMKQFGYTVPTTWQQYEALSDKVAAQHPGYILGTAGDAWTPEMYFWGSQCPASDVTGAKAITVKTTGPDCTRAANMLDHMIANKTMSTESLFGPDFATDEASKVLMLPGPSWYGGTLFEDTLKTPAGQIAAAAPLQWTANDKKPVTGDVGGGAWWISSHSKHLAEAVSFAEWVTSQYKYGSAQSPTYPANTAAATKWLALTQKSGYYANDIGPVVLKAAGEVWTGWTPPAFSQESVWASTVQPGITAGKTIASMLPAWGQAITNQAKILGYTVK